MAIGSYWMADAADEWAVAARMGRNAIAGTAGNDRLVGTAGNDDFLLGAGGNDTAHGLAGNDRFFFGDSYTPKDMVDGGDGSDVVRFTGDRDDAIVIDPEHSQSIERVSLVNTGSKYVIGDGFNHLFVGGNHNALVDASAFTSGSVTFRGDGPSILIGGSGNDVFFSGVGDNLFTGNGGKDLYVYNSVSDSSARDNYDVITDFSREDVIRLPTRAGGYHLSSDTNERGDVKITFDNVSNQTILEVHLDNDDERGNLLIHLDENLSLALPHDSQIVVG